MLQEQEVHAAQVMQLKLVTCRFSCISTNYLLLDLMRKCLTSTQMERTFIAIKPDGVQRGLVSIDLELPLRYYLFLGFSYDHNKCLLAILV